MVIVDVCYHCEDEGLAKSNLNEDLLTLSSTCGVGIDTLTS